MTVRDWRWGTKAPFWELPVCLECFDSLHLVWDWLLRKTNTAIFLPRLQNHSLRIHKALLTSADSINAEDTGLHLVYVSCRKGFCMRGLWLQFRCSFPSRNILQWSNSIIKSLQFISTCFISSARVSSFFFIFFFGKAMKKIKIFAVLHFYKTSYLGNREKNSGSVVQHNQTSNAKWQCSANANASGELSRFLIAQRVPIWACLYANTNSVWHKLYELYYLTSKYFLSSVWFHIYLINAFRSV